MRNHKLAAGALAHSRGLPMPCKHMCKNRQLGKRKNTAAAQDAQKSHAYILVTQPLNLRRQLMMHDCTSEVFFCLRTFSVSHFYDTLIGILLGKSTIEY